MPYQPDQPWDKSLSYTYGQTCYYNGLRYMWWSPEYNSNENVEPYKDLVLFTAYGDAGDGIDSDLDGIEKRLERGWILREASNAASIARMIRGLPQNAGLGNAWFEYNQGIKFFSKNHLRSKSYEEINPSTGQMQTYYTFELPTNSRLKSWAFYGNVDGEYVNSLPGLSTDYGLRNDYVDPSVPPSNGDPFVGTYVNQAPDEITPQGPSLQEANEPPPPVEPEDPENPTPPPPPPIPPEENPDLFLKLQPVWYIDLTTYWQHGAADTINLAMWFNRTCAYTIYVLYTKEYNPDDLRIILIQTASGTTQSGPIRDSWNETPVKGTIHTFTKPVGSNQYTYITYYIVWESFTPTLTQ